MTSPILVTGASQRIGLAFAMHCLEQGTPVIATYRTRRPAVDNLQEAGARCFYADFATNAGIDAFISTLREETASLRAIIHNASDWLPESPDSDPAEVMAAMMQIHCTTPYRINLACRDLLENSDSVTDIVHMTDYVVEKGSAKHIAYAASKAALENLTLSFARLLAPQVKVNSVAPSLIMFNEGDSEAYREKTLKKSLLGIAPGETAAVQALQFLLDNPYVTGRSIGLDGGRPLV
ncbi:dihydromonapterin reductase [Spiribacter vilamensis]|uniref:Dihydromonapterin reductase n=1 Tax=Spiribacter vilamensis TaxID=531306 RepID=A0A4Q8CZU5_9GAMM|nr:dihydromonapterin reductase [Spiribacter vilamensis]RZU98566.1 dihydromonapterin reductase/dihydrofolate reductase [Spiribacter vilamensis]TVO60174.1 dihydromonapterin reductase [Spiribacter vilamensis]